MLYGSSTFKTPFLIVIAILGDFTSSIFITPFSPYENSDYFWDYYADHSLFIAHIDEESKQDLIINKNCGIYNGALYESLVSEVLIAKD